MRMRNTVLYLCGTSSTYPFVDVFSRPGHGVLPTSPVSHMMWNRAVLLQLDMRAISAPADSAVTRAAPSSAPKRAPQLQ